MMQVQKAGALPMHKGPGTWCGEEKTGAMALPPNAHNVEPLHLVASGASGKSLTFIFFSTCRPGRKAGTGRFCILWETVHVAVGKGRKGTSLMFSVRGDTAVVQPSLAECLQAFLPQETCGY